MQHRQQLLLPHQRPQLGHGAGRHRTVTFSNNASNTIYSSKFRLDPEHRLGYHDQRRGRDHRYIRADDHQRRRHRRQHQRQDHFADGGLDDNGTFKAEGGDVLSQRHQRSVIMTGGRHAVRAAPTRSPASRRSPGTGADRRGQLCSGSAPTSTGRRHDQRLAGGRHHRRGRPDHPERRQPDRHAGHADHAGTITIGSGSTLAGPAAPSPTRKPPAALPCRGAAPCGWHGQYRRRHPRGQRHHQRQPGQLRPDRRHEQIAGPRPVPSCTWPTRAATQSIVSRKTAMTWVASLPTVMIPWRCLCVTLPAISMFLSTKITLYASSPPQGPIGIFASTGLSNPFGMVFDAAGNLYVLNYNNGSSSPRGWIEKFSPTGTDLADSPSLRQPPGITTSTSRLTPVAISTLIPYQVRSASMSMERIWASSRADSLRPTAWPLIRAVTCT